MKKILVIGSLNIDVTIAMQKLPRPGETCMGEGYYYTPGGKGANQAYAAGRQGVEVRMLGCVGDDRFGDRVIESLKEASVGTEAIDKGRREQTTGTAFIMTDVNGANLISVIPGANRDCDLTFLESKSDLIDWCDILLLQMEIPQRTVEEVIRIGSEKGKMIILNPAPAPTSMAQDILGKIDYLTPNEIELQALTNSSVDSEEEVRQAAQKLCDQGVKNVLVTLGDKGVLWLTDGMNILYPADEVEAIDSTAAGDCFNGIFAAELARGRKVQEAILIANAGAGISVTRKGAQTSIPDKKEIESVVGGM